MLKKSYFRHYGAGAYIARKPRLESIYITSEIPARVAIFAAGVT